MLSSSPNRGDAFSFPDTKHCSVLDCELTIKPGGLWYSSFNLPTRSLHYLRALYLGSKGTPRAFNYQHRMRRWELASTPTLSGFGVLPPFGRSLSGLLHVWAGGGTQALGVPLHVIMIAAATLTAHSRWNQLGSYRSLGCASRLQWQRMEILQQYAKLRTATVSRYTRISPQSAILW
jgi:hypothetical protein